MVTERLRKVYFDSCVFLALFLGEKDRAEPAGAAITLAEQHLVRGYISPLTVAETVGAPSLRAPQGRPTEAQARRLDRARDYFLATNLQYLDIAQVAAERAMEHAVTFQLKGADALHLALAQLAHCEELYTYDDKLLKVDTQVAGLCVRTPYGDPQGELTV